MKIQFSVHKCRNPLNQVIHLNEKLDDGFTGMKTCRNPLNQVIHLNIELPIQVQKPVLLCRNPLNQVIHLNEKQSFRIGLVFRCVVIP